MSVRRSISIIFVAKYLEHGLALISGMVLARWLTPQDFGIYSIAASIVLMGYLFRNFGVGQYIVQAREVTDDMLRAAFSVTLLVSWTIGVAILAGAPFVGEFYEEEGVTLVLYFLSLNFFLLPFGSIVNALLRRDMRFEKLAVIDISAAVTSLVVGLTAAWFGASYLAIAWAANASTLVSILITQLYRPAGTPWLPGVKRMREALLFGAKVGALDFTNSGSDAATELVIGKSQSLHDLGIYSRAYGTYRLFEFAFLQSVRPVILPFLSKSKHAQENLGDIYLKIITLTAIITIPFFIFLGINAGEVILLLYGDQWNAAVPVLHIMCAAGVLSAPTLFFEQLLIAHGRPGQALRVIATSQALRLAALAVLAWVSLEAAAAALIVGFSARVFMVVRMSRLHFALQLGSLFRAVLPAVLCGAAIGLACIAIRAALGAAQPAFVVLLMSAAVAALTWLAAVFALQHPVAQELRVVVAKVRERG